MTKETKGNLRNNKQKRAKNTEGTIKAESKKRKKDNRKGMNEEDIIRKIMMNSQERTTARNIQ